MTLASDTDRLGLKVGSPGLRSIGPITFGPEGILFVADSEAATIFAIESPPGRRARDGGASGHRATWTRGWRRTSAARARTCIIRDMAVHPTSQEVYLSVMRGGGARAAAGAREGRRRGSLAAVALEDVPFRQASIADAPAEDDARAGSPRRRDERRARRRGDGAAARVQAAHRARPAAQGDGHRHRLRRRRGAGRRAPRTRSSSRRCGASRSRSRGDAALELARDLPRLARQVRDGVANPHVRAVRRRKRDPRELHVHARRAFLAPGHAQQQTAQGPDGGGAGRRQHAARHGVVPARRERSTCSSRTAGTR